MTTKADVFFRAEQSRESMVNYARSRVGDAASDCVQEAIIKVAGLPNPPLGDIEGLLMLALKWACANEQRRRTEVEVLESELGTIDDDGEERLMELSDLEVQDSSPPPAWPSAVDHVTPEDEAGAAQLRNRIAYYGRTICGDRDYAIFCAVVMDQVPQWKVAREHDINQASVSRIVNHVRHAIADKLKGEGYDI